MTILIRPSVLFVVRRLAPSLLGTLLLTPGAWAQGARVPAATVQRVVSAEFAYCSQSETATSAQLDALAAKIQAEIAAQQRATTAAVADSSARHTAFKDAEKALKQLDDSKGPLDAELNIIEAAQKPFEDRMAATERAENPAGGPTRLQQIESEMTGFQDQIARLQAELKTIKDPDNWLQGRDEQINAEIAGYRTKWEALRDERRGIIRQVHTDRYNPEYLRLLQEEEKLRERIGEIQNKIEDAKNARDRAKNRYEAIDLAALELAHEENLYLYEHLTRAQHCVDKRRAALAGEAPAVATTAKGTVTGRWGVLCKWKDPEMSDITDGGTFSLTLTGSGGVNGTYLSSNSTYPVGGNVGADGTASGSGSAADWSVNWGGRFSQPSGGAIVGGGSVNVTLTSFGGGTCGGSWTAP
ncbi:MAG: hypothetical protein ABR559_04750 [Gemmatimonadota bacterium]